MIISARLNSIEAGQKFDLSLDQVEQFLNEDEEKIKSKQG